MTRATSLRNRLARGYATVDLPRLWTELPGGLDALDEYARAIATYASREAE